MGKRSRGDSRGAALVELAFALPILIMLVLGIVSGGIAYNHQLALTHSAREAGRYAATLPVINFGSMDMWLEEVASRALDEGTGSLDPGAPGLVICVAFVHPDGSLATDSTRTRQEVGGVVTYASGSSCFDDGRPSDERRVQVRVARETTFNVFVYSSTLTLDSEATNRFEAGVGF